ncbi:MULTISPECIES: hypothetical protein [Priestia]|jgi:hypothetical protein|uniref:Uncharacterized protein n=2 Tax=Priestia TaxID=2800373 RepID=D5E2X0_PRIM1|nr:MULTISPECIES: hypothetical protein [Priestia]AVX09686.1 hypothetical protein CS527_18910 [Bacillus sp. Y-01]KOP75799.1 hypothetical protein AMS61_16170 [Bacillus sp. FJAT-21351]KQU22628.1 hypothetical protein ASG61_03470 [Bacillus sp. Leaf75]MBZ5483261.1 hypothetical protein [Bacillus sp. T_4]MCJ7985109.1 hypothetical protein [Priestia sp. OVL9]MDH6653234.1 hypothetical protein [Bacillus sp. PvP124]MDP9576665.1 hypothetical protein [Bacillus sp. 1751]
MKKKIVDAAHLEQKTQIEKVINGMTFTKNFRSATAEEWYVFLPGYEDPRTGGAAGKAMIHYNLYGNRDVFINTTVILDDPALFRTEIHPLVYAIADELVNRLVGYADTLLSVHAGENSFDAEYKQKNN